MAAQLEEMIAPPDPVDVQDLAPDLRQGRFQLALGGLVLAGEQRFQLGLGQGPAIDFAVGRQR